MTYVVKHYAGLLHISQLLFSQDDNLTRVGRVKNSMGSLIGT